MGDTIQFCPECGTKLDARAEFCSECGISLKEDASSEKSAKPEKSEKPAVSADKAAPPLLQPPEEKVGTDVQFIPSTAKKSGIFSMALGTLILAGLGINLLQYGNLNQMHTVVLAIAGAGLLLLGFSLFFARHGVEIDRRNGTVKIMGGNNETLRLADFPDLSYEAWRGVLHGEEGPSEYDVSLVRLLGADREIVLAGSRDVHPWMQKVDREGLEAARKAAYRIAGFLKRPVMDQTETYLSRPLVSKSRKTMIPPDSAVSASLKDRCRVENRRFEIKNVTGEILLEVLPDHCLVRYQTLLRGKNTGTQVASQTAGGMFRIGWNEIVEAQASLPLNAYEDMAMIIRTETCEYRVPGFYRLEDALWAREVMLAMLSQD